MINDKISVILVNYNGKEYNDKCIMSILSSSIGEQLQIVVVDNASTDDSLKQLHEHWDDNAHVSIIELEDNYGFSKANNAGIEWSITQGINYFCLLNNDTEIETDAIEKMLEVHKETGHIVVPKILHDDRRDIIWCAGGEFSSVIRKPKQRGCNQPDKGIFDQSGTCGFANGCCLLLSKDIIDKIGFLDERFFLYYEDTEYSLRAYENGVGIWYCPSAIVYHKVNGSTGGNEKPANAYYITRNWLLCNRQHFKTGRFSLFCIYFICNRLAWMMIWAIKGKWNMNKATLQAIRDFFRQKWGKYKS